MNKNYSNHDKNSTAETKPASSCSKKQSSNLSIFYCIVKILFIAAIIASLLYFALKQNIMNKEWQNLQQELRDNNEFNYQQVYNYINQNYTELNTKLDNIDKNISLDIEQMITEKLNQKFSSIGLEKDKFKIFQAILLLQKSQLNNTASNSLIEQANKKLSAVSSYNVAPQMRKLEHLLDNKNNSTKSLLLKLKELEQSIINTNFSLPKHKQDNSIVTEIKQTNAENSYWNLLTKSIRQVYNSIKPYLIIRTEGKKSELIDSLSISMLKERLLLILQNMKLAIITNNSNLYLESLDDIKSNLSYKNLYIQDDSKIADSLDNLTNYNIDNLFDSTLQKVIDDLEYMTQ